MQAFQNPSSPNSNENEISLLHYHYLSKHSSDENKGSYHQGQDVLCIAIAILVLKGMNSSVRHHSLIFTAFFFVCMHRS